MKKTVGIALRLSLITPALFSLVKANLILNEAIYFHLKSQCDRRGYHE
jgi:hypothetical protein